MYRYFCPNCGEVTESKLLDSKQEKQGSVVVWVRKFRCMVCLEVYTSNVPLVV